MVVIAGHYDQSQRKSAHPSNPILLGAFMLFYFPQYLGPVGLLTNMFGMGSNHRPESVLQTRVLKSLQPYSIPIYRAIISLQTSTDEAPSGFVHDALAMKARVTVRVFLKE